MPLGIRKHAQLAYTLRNEFIVQNTLGITLTFLGTSGSVVTAKRACAGIFFEDKLLDVGFGVLTNFVKSGFDFDLINELYISHTHSDHIGDFTGLIWAMAMEGRVKPLQIISSSSAASSLKKILELQSTPKSGFVKFELKFKTPEKVNVLCQKTIHDPENYAYKFKTNGSEFVYTGDTAKDESLLKFAKRSDLLIHDGTFLASQESLAKLTNHSTAKEAAETAAGAGVGKLVMTHIAPINEGRDLNYLDEAAEVSKEKVIVAKDLMKLQL